MRPTRLDLGIALLLMAGTATAFGPALSADFISLDDSGYVWINPHVSTGLTSRNATWAWTTFDQGNWHPLTWLSLQLDASLWKTADGKPDARGFHLTNVLLHAANAALLFFALQALTGSRWRGAMVAALFAVHPLRVESVAWVSERKDVLSVFFGLLALWAYAGYARRGGLARYSAVAGLQALSLLSKPTLVTLPCLMLVLDWWPLERVSRISVWRWLAVEKLPLLALSVCSCAATFLAQRSGGSVVSLAALPFATRLANALVAYAAYLFMTVWPANLAPMYPCVEGGWPAWTVALAALTVGGLTALAVWQRRRRPYLMTGWLWYLGTLVPVIGLVQVGDQAFADRYSYFPLIGPCLALVWAAAEVVPLSTTRWAFAAAAVPVMALSALTWRQAALWKDDYTLWSHTLEVGRPNAYAYYIVGAAIEARDKKLDTAEKYYERAVKTNPGYPKGQYNLGRVRRKQGRGADAVAHLRAALRADPGLAEAHEELAKALSEQQSFAEAELQFRESLRLSPESALFHSDFAWFLEVTGRDQEALEHYRQAVVLSPGDNVLQSRLARLLAKHADSQ